MKSHTIKLSSIINAPVERVFDLSRSIDLHILSTSHTGEKAVAGRTSGLIGLGESVTWQARHFGLVQHLTSKVTEYRRPYFFADEMVKGAFKSFRHEHTFTPATGGKTLMTDTFTFAAPLGILGYVFSLLVLKGYMKTLLEKRNRVIKQTAEGDKWPMLLNSPANNSSHQA